MQSLRCRLHDCSWAESNVHQRQHCDLYRRMDKSEYELEKVLAARGPAEHRFYLLKYKGYGPEFNKWSPDQWCSCSDKITEFCRENDLAVEDMWVSGFKYMIFLGGGFLRYGRVSSRQPKDFCRCNRVFEPHKCNRNDKISFFSNLLT